MKTATIGRDAPQERRAPAAEITDRVRQRAEQEARVRERDHEAVVPAKRLEELLFLDYCCRHNQPPSGCRDRGAADAACARTYHGRADDSKGVQRNCHGRNGPRYGPRYDRGMRAPPITITCDCGARPQVRVRRRWTCRDLRQDVGHRADPARRLRRARRGAYAATGCSCSGRRSSSRRSSSRSRSSSASGTRSSSSCS